ncbi:class I SAM-dependent methyltransferase [Streptomyces sp. TRM68367]|uniref:class I SAM-dependent methyltransferase n=1 Tax=Streptomyces sp. TRM68367 TaxID=2758415 RepID=UPI00165BAA82|nr:class I SAM-dependent methyltransferase [Streptomyces sp. TRM68367]MBC9723853.1 class I SAM-dependent methyltransferase [Streptomyces sp. TRM68367]
MPMAAARRPKIKHPFFARLYPRINAFAEAHGGLDHRRELLADTEGCVVEVGAGTGANFAHYPAKVEKVIAVEPEPRLRKLATGAAAESSAPVDVREGRAEELPVPDGSVDGVVASLVLCSIADVPAALAEAARVLRPGGRLYFYEHIRSADPRFARKQRRINLVWPLLAGGCNLDQDPERAIEEAGFTIEHARHFDFLVNGRTTPSSPCVIGVARKPES